MTWKVLGTQRFHVLVQTPTHCEVVWCFNQSNADVDTCILVHDARDCPLEQVMWPDFIDSVSASDAADELEEAIVVD